MARKRIAIIGLGMASAPHAKSLLDLTDRVEVARRLQPDAGAAARLSRNLAGCR